jgi:hypothetical protein
LPGRSREGYKARLLVNRADLSIVWSKSIATCGRRPDECLHGSAGESDVPVRC